MGRLRGLVREGSSEDKCRTFLERSFNVLPWGLAFTDLDPWVNKNTLLAYPARTFEASASQVQVRDWRPLQCRNIAWHQRRVRFENGRDLDDWCVWPWAIARHEATPEIQTT